MTELLEKFATYIVTHLFHLSEGKLYGALTFFIADTVKILVLLCAVIFIAAIIRSYLPPDRIRHFLAGKNSVFASVLAALVGIVTPFCSCSAIPLFLGFIEAGVPVGATFSFLIASPMVNEVALVLLFGLFGLKAALLYALFGLLIAIISGLILGKLRAERWIINIEATGIAKLTGIMPFKARLDYAKRYTIYLVAKLWYYVLLGIAIGAGIHGYVPVDFFGNIAGREHWYAVPAAVLLGVPLYSNAAGIIPLVSVFTEKGVAIGTVLAFMMAVTGLSLPEFLILKRVLRWQLLGFFIGTITIGIILAGYLFNYILK